MMISLLSIRIIGGRLSATGSGINTESLLTLYDIFSRRDHRELFKKISAVSAGKKMREYFQQRFSV
jgi:hypothetical protein